MPSLAANFPSPPCVYSGCHIPKIFNLFQFLSFQEIRSILSSLMSRSHLWVYEYPDVYDAPNATLINCAIYTECAIHNVKCAIHNVECAIHSVECAIPY
ncbi:hypothetical protein C8R48DRAFT_182828 [Suillus tomentosus]|nr:hypothetical protein C8R48DRAFT_182828 [Suillus tomentosus]